VDAERAPVNMTHGQKNLKVSLDEASRASEATKRRLLSTKKLSLVVDLDQTVIHATVDPTVADWQNDESNPNHNAVKDVQSFQLQDEGPGNRICSYYIKMRPGLREFLEEVSKLYELHIYTMGTRSYAQNVAKIVDPDQKLFGDRILSRDESGSMTLKKLSRLFPVNTDMVVIIDDRADVWSYSPNLIRVTPYDFFVGIGDINSSFLPKRKDLVQSTASLEIETVIAKKAEAVADEDAPEDEPRVLEDETPAAPAPTIEEQLVAMAGNNNPILLEKQGHEQQEELTAQLEERPLLKKQEQLDKQDEEESKENIGENGTQETVETFTRHNLLNDDDRELEPLCKNLQHIHEVFYYEYERNVAGSQGGRIAELRGEKAKKRPDEELALVPDVKKLLPQLKQDVLKDVIICFTGVIPQNVDHKKSDMGLWAISFNAIVDPQLTKYTTHVIAHRERRTSKVRQAAKHSQIKIVTINWLIECFVRWEHVDEEPFKIEVEPDDRAADLDDLDYHSSDGGQHGGLNGVADDMDEEDDEPPISPISEVLPTNQGDWDDMEDELDDYLNSSGSEDSDASGTESDASISSKRSRKRKRARSDTGSDGEAANGDAPNGVNGQPESELQKRKKRAMERTTSLTQVANAEQTSGLPSPDETGPEEEEPGVAVKKDANPVAADEAGEDDDDLEALMMAEFEKGDYEGDE
jgi:RNA polymerase II subunit A-like phosphatase